jgi:hypothetical protein
LEQWTKRGSKAWKSGNRRSRFARHSPDARPTAYPNLDDNLTPTAKEKYRNAIDTKIKGLTRMAFP